MKTPKQPPACLSDNEFTPITGEFHPFPLPRRGEWTAYGLAGALLITLGIRWWFTQEAPPLLAVAAFGCVLLAVLISYGNWMERNTTLRISDSGFSFERPTHTIQGSWDQIIELNCWRARGGWRYEVQTEHGHFRFQEEVVMRSNFGGEVRTGYPDGSMIVASIRRRAELGTPGWVEDRWRCRR